MKREHDFTTLIPFWLRTMTFFILLNAGIT